MKIDSDKPDLAKVTKIQKDTHKTVQCPISQFMSCHYRHFNAAITIDAARAYERHLENDGKMFLTMGGAMSTAELGLSLAEMIRQDKIHGICCTGANLEEDVFNLVAHEHYVRIQNYRELTPNDEENLFERHLNRVTDTCIPEAEALRRIENAILEEWVAADCASKRFFPHEFMFKIILSGKLKQYYQIDPRDSWLMEAAIRNLPIFVPGWEDSTLGNIYAAHCISGEIKHVHTVKTGIEYMVLLAGWYTQIAPKGLGFFKSAVALPAIFPSAWCRCSIST